MKDLTFSPLKEINWFILNNPKTYSHNMKKAAKIYEGDNYTFEASLEMTKAIDVACGSYIYNNQNANIAIIIYISSILKKKFYEYLQGYRTDLWKEKLMCHVFNN